MAEARANERSRHYGGYFDRDIIAYSIIEQGADADIQGYLAWFKEYPDVDPDFLFAVINFLMVSERDTTLIDLLQATYDPLIRSTKVMGGGEWLKGFCAH